MAKATAEVHIEYIPLADVQPAERNPKDHDVGVLVESLRRFGFVAPAIRNDKTGRIVVGHGRLEALQQLQAEGGPPPARIKKAKGGTWLLPVVCGVAFDNEAEAEAYLVGDNRTTELGGWLDHVLHDSLATLLQQDADALRGTGYDADDVDDLGALLALSGEQRPGVEDIDGVSSIVEELGHERGKTDKNERWFYVEFYAEEDKERHDGLRERLMPYLVRKGRQIPNDLFFDAISNHLDAIDAAAGTDE